MSELVTTYLLKQSENATPMKREDFYTEQIQAYKTTGSPSRAVEIVQVILFTQEKEIILQKRSSTKRHNPRLIDKTVGGHVTYGDKPNYTVMVETLQELKVPSFVLYTDEDFQKTYTLLKNYNIFQLSSFVNYFFYHVKTMLNHLAY